jgi:ElaB/YqjD/DUF883 family membrane-anchored ribosome-binding protein
MADTMTDQAQDITNRVQGAARGATSAVRDRASEAVEKACDVMSQAAESAKEGVSRLQGTAQEYFRQGREKVQAAGEAVQGTIEERPLSSVLVALGCGFLAGILLSRIFMPERG